VKFKFGKQPRGNKGKRVWQSKKEQKKAKKTSIFTKKKKPAVYTYSIVQSKDTRVKTFKTKEEAVIARNKMKESQPQHKYKIVTEKQPERGW